MADNQSAAVEDTAKSAVDALRVARARLAAGANGPTTVDAHCGIVQEAADYLALAAAEPSCPTGLSTILLDWRDRLGSHVLAARALADLDVHHDLAEQMLCRGLDEAIQESGPRLAELRAKLDDATVFTA